MYWRGDYSHLYKLYIKNPEEHHSKYRSKYFLGDQAFIQDNVDCIKFLNECTKEKFMLWTKDLNFTVTEDTGLTLFLGKKCKPHMIPDHPYIKQHWY